MIFIINENLRFFIKRSFFNKKIKGQLIFLFTLITIFLVTYIQEKTVHAQESQKPLSVTDMITVSEGEKTVIYLIDAKTEGLYYLDISASSSQEISTLEKQPKTINLDEFTHIPFVDGEIDEPSAIAYFQGKILICEKDDSSAAIYELDLKSPENIKKLNKIISKPQVKEPKSISISEKGVIAIGDHEKNKVILFEPDLEYPNERKFKPGRELAFIYNSKNPHSEFDEPNRLSFFGDSLLVLESNQGKLHIIDGEFAPSQNRRFEEVNKFLSEIHSNNKITDFVVYNGVFYIADKNAITAFAPFSSHEKSVAKARDDFKNSKRFLPTRLAATPEFLLIADKESKEIIKIPRLVPVNINFEFKTNDPTSKENSLENELIAQRDALVNLYEYLDKQDILPKHAIITKQNYNDPDKYENLRNLLIEEKVLIERPEPSWIKKITNKEYLKRLENLFCKLNQQFCNKQNELSQIIPKETQLILPKIPIEESLTTSDVILNNRTVRQHLAERVTESLKHLVTTESLFRINKEKLKYVESELAKANFLPASEPSRTLKPGSLIIFKDGKEKIVGDLSNCGLQMDGKVKSEIWETPSVFWSKSVNTILPKINENDQKTTLSEVNGINGVYVKFKEWYIQSISDQFLEEIRNTVVTNDQCRILSEEDVYVINAAVETKDAQYNLLKDGLKKALSQNELQASNILGDVLIDKEYNFIVKEPRYIGYSLLKVTPQKPIKEWQQIKKNPILEQLILNETNNTLTLPATRWRLSLFVQSASIKNESLQLYTAICPKIDPSKFYTTHCPLNIQGDQLLQVSSNTIEPFLAYSQQDQDPFKEAKDYRKKLLDKIGDYPIDRRLETVFIGVAETNIKKDHPDFADILYEVKGDHVIPITHQNSESETSLVINKKFVIKDDHAAHVAGLIGAKGEVLPGLSKGVKLVLIDTSSTSEAFLENQIDKAITYGVRIFNFSFTFGNAKTEQHPKVESINNLLTKMQKDENWRKALFVMAAGNEKRQLSEIKIAPISWTDDLSNAIGVGATFLDNFNFLSCDPANPIENCLGGSNYGKKFVQIAAPGQTIYSTSSKGYASASGTSQAAPIVTAAAARLESLGIVGPTAIKTRLIYTTDWTTEIGDNSWGGRLNFRNAVMQPHENLIRFQSKKDEIYSFNFKNKVTDSEKKNYNKEEYFFDKNRRPVLKILNGGDEGSCIVNDSGDDVVSCPTEIAFEHILRLQWVTNKSDQTVLRVYYLQHLQGKIQLMVFDNVDLDGAIPCRELKIWNEIGGTFGEATCKDLRIKENLGDYIAKSPTQIHITF
jgi:hypothetical protein